MDAEEDEGTEGRRDDESGLDSSVGLEDGMSLEGQIHDDVVELHRDTAGGDRQSVEEKKMLRMIMDFSRVKIVHSESISAVQTLTADDIYTLARLQKNSLRYTVDEEAAGVDDIASSLSAMLYGDKHGPLMPEACLRLNIADHVAAALITVLESDTNTPLITYAMTHRLHKRTGCMGVLMRLALSQLKMNGYNSCSVVINENNEPVLRYFEAFGFGPEDQGQ